DPDRPVLEVVHHELVGRRRVRLVEATGGRDGEVVAAHRGRELVVERIRGVLPAVDPVGLHTLDALVCGADQLAAARGTAGAAVALRARAGCLVVVAPATRGDGDQDDEKSRYQATDHGVGP